MPCAAVNTASTRRLLYSKYDCNSASTPCPFAPGISCKAAYPGAERAGAQGQDEPPLQAHGIYREAAARHHPADRGAVQDLCGADHRHRTQPPHTGRIDRPECRRSPRIRRGNGGENTQPAAKTAHTAQEDGADGSAVQG